MAKAPPKTLSLSERFSPVRTLANEFHAVLRIVAADKLHNARCTLAELEQTGPAVWNRFKTGREGTLLYLEEILKILRLNLPGPETRELARAIDRLLHASANA